MLSKLTIRSSRVAMLSSGFAFGLALCAEPALTYAQAPSNEVFGSDDWWSKNDERAPECASLNNAHRHLTQQLYQSRDPKANQQLAKERAPIHEQLIECLAQALKGEATEHIGGEPEKEKTPPVPLPRNTAVRIVTSIDKFFTDIFNSHGKTYTPPGVKRNPELAKWEEDGKTLVGKPAQYGPKTGVLEYSPDYLKFIHEKFSNYEVAATLAHEVAHRAQLLSGQPFVTGKEKDWELQADRLSGAYMRSVMEGAPLLPNREAALLRFYRTVGSHDPTGHGTPEERLAAFKAGYQHGAPAELFKP